MSINSKCFANRNIFVKALTLSCLIFGPTGAGEKKLLRL